MLAGQAREIEARWRRATPESEARDSDHYRAAMAARAARRRVGRPAWRPRFRARLTTSLRALAAGVGALAR